MRDPIIVDFGDPEEFCEELRRQEAVSYNVVRVTTIQRPLNLGPHARSITFCATAIVAAGQLLLRLKFHAGDILFPEANDGVLDRIAKARRFVEAHAEQLKLEVRNGVYSTDRGL